MRNHTITASSAVMAALAGLAASPSYAQGVVSTTLIPAGAINSKVKGYGPAHIELSPNRPTAVTKLPEGVSAAPLYGTLTFTPAGKTVSFSVLLDEPDNAPARLFVDTNGNGDLTDDPAIVWTPKMFKSRDGNMYPQWISSALVDLPLDGGKIARVGIGVYRFSKNDPTRGKLKMNLMYFHDYARIGEATLGGKKYSVLLDDINSRGDFSDKALTRLMIDRDGAGIYSGPGREYSAARPFNIGGTTYEVESIAADGSQFTIVPSKQTVAEYVAPKPVVLVGKKALAFSAKTTGGSDIEFPTTYKGKLVLLDFWATWCGPCKAELPKLTAAYKQFHDAGVDVLGISLDHENVGDRLAEFTKSNDMPWPQIYDGGYWKARVATLYSIRSIPAPILVDGDTGMIMAAGEELRGDRLAATLQKALDQKKAAPAAKTVSLAR